MIYRVAILYICTGRYSMFWNSFYKSCEKFFLPDHDKHYFVFTDAEIAHQDDRNVHKVWQTKLGWPDDTLKRFHMFDRIKQELSVFDFVFFFNSNIIFMQPVNVEILPTTDQGIVVTQHPSFYNKKVDKFPYERNEESCACIPFGAGKHYVLGGINGGHSGNWLTLIEDLKNAVDEDEKNGVVALWHDESHLNRYIIDRQYKILTPEYACPEGWKLPFKEKVRILDKTRHGGHDYLRGLSDTPIESVINITDSEGVRPGKWLYAITSIFKKSGKV